MKLPSHLGRSIGDSGWPERDPREEILQQNAPHVPLVTSVDEVGLNVDTRVD